MGDPQSDRTLAQHQRQAAIEARSRARLDRMRGDLGGLEPEDMLRLARACVDAVKPDADELLAALTADETVDHEGKITSATDTSLLERMVSTAADVLAVKQDEVINLDRYYRAVLAPLADAQLDELAVALGRTKEARAGAAKRRAERANLAPPDSADRCAQRGHLFDADTKRCQRTGCKAVAP